MKFLLLFLIIFINVFAQDWDRFAAREIIELPVGRFPEPDCRYSVHHKSQNGPLVRSKVNIGDEIYHYWNCNYKNNPKNYLFCVAVNNCTVSDNERIIQIIDENGCSKYPSILPDVSYQDDLSAGIHVHAFSLDVETTAVHFTCNIRMIIKENGLCHRPICHSK
ncbi:unnamed protein product [Caenorhabditis angaria]|uniref:ZP domain-containing protein n=1 Tax=Caenorhabditis angaria TaxID=860376 RepID=A0A9P1IC77_9PELO|nr:unnamed protein product [Caenorhabditis angaria]